MCLGPFEKWLDVPESRPRLAYRAFRKDEAGGLRSVFRYTAYSLGETHHDPFIRRRSASRGFYALRTLGSARCQYSDMNVIFAAVHLWGRIGQHRRGYVVLRKRGRAGYRAEYMKIVKVYR